MKAGEKRVPGWVFFKEKIFKKKKNGKTNARPFDQLVCAES